MDAAFRRVVVRARPPLSGTVLVTGASSGIGRAMAVELARHARVLVVLGRRQERLAALAEELRRRRATLRVEPVSCDLADLDAVSDVVASTTEKVGPIDVLVNAAGVGDEGLFESGRWERARDVIAINVTAPTFLAHKLVPGMVARGRGGILNVSSGFGYAFMPGYATYGGSKHYLTAFTETLRIELAPAGVVVSQVCPGPVPTEFDERSRRPGETNVGGCPPWLAVSPEQCARDSVAAFAAGRAFIVPGFRMRLVSWLDRATPRAIARLSHRPFARKLRAGAA